ncbi:MAG: DNA repair protein RadC [Lachnoclostridium sp.]|nr:DNA repair protein RadC [Lachnoclostridium sp.]
MIEEINEFDQCRPLRIADLDSDDKPREKALSMGIRSLTNAELMAIILGGGIQGMSVIDLARLILHRNGNSLTAVAKMSLAEMSAKFKGVGPAKAVSLAAAFELGARYRDEMARPEGMTIRGAEDVYKLMRSQLEVIDHEEFWILLLSRSNQVKFKICISQGGTAATVVDIKMLLKRALDGLADSIILVHNHPSGNLRPSVEDERLTRRIKDGAAMLDIRVLDHVIIGQGGYYSFRDNSNVL